MFDLLFCNNYLNVNKVNQKNDVHNQSNNSLTLDLRSVLMKRSVVC